MIHVFKNVGETSAAKNTFVLFFFSVVSKIFEKLVNNRIEDHLEKLIFLLISSMALGLLNQRQIFLRLYLIELLELLIGLVLLEL